jgi:DnaJ family protein B protein 12
MKESDYTDDQVVHVQRIKRCSDYYEVLQVSKSANEAELKKNYRKLALQLHPDKNKAPGAAEAFKAVGNAFAVLNDKDKRHQYDLYGSDEVSNGQASSSSRSAHYAGNDGGDGYYYDYSRGFEGKSLEVHGRSCNQI